MKTTTSSSSTTETATANAAGADSRTHDEIMADQYAAMDEDTRRDYEAEKNAPTPGPYYITYEPYPCAKNGQGEPNPPSAFLWPDESDEAIALVFGQGDDPFDSPSQRANARLFAASWDYRAACTPERLQALDRLIEVLAERVWEAQTEDDVQAVSGFLEDLRAATARATTTGGTP